jgi:hypothetical protein
MTWILRVAFAGLLAVTLSAGSASLADAAQQVVTQADVQRLQDNVYLADRDISQLRSRDSARASQLSLELDELRDEVVYLKVKLRKERTLSRTEYADVRDRIEDVRTQARGDAAGAFTPPPSSTATGRSTTSPAPRPLPTGVVEIPSGTEIDVRLQNSLNSGTAQVEDRFEGTTLVDLTAGGVVAIPSGSVMRGVVTAVEPGTRTNRTARMTVSFDQVTIQGRSYPMRGTVTQAIEGEGIRGELGRTGVGAIGGAILGGILGGAKGAILGTIIGGGGTIAATEGREVDLPQGSVLRVRIDSPLEIQTGRWIDTPSAR